MSQTEILNALKLAHSILQNIVGYEGAEMDEIEKVILDAENKSN